MNRGGFSWKIFLGITAQKRKASKMIGIPMTKSGRKYAAGNGNVWAMLFNLIFK
jgi:hypothetical protein